MQSIIYSDSNINFLELSGIDLSLPGEKKIAMSGLDVSNIDFD